MDRELILWALINDKKQLNKKDVIDVINKSGSIDNIFNNYDMIKSKEFNRNYLKILEKIMNFIKYRPENIELYKNEIIRLRASSVDFIPFFSDNYPKKLRFIQDPPLLLYHKGNNFDFGNCVAIVGTRNLSHFGHKRAREISNEIGSKGYTIVSGLARGTDTEAHCGALDSGGKTIAVLAGHIEEIFPKENEKLALDIISSGAIISEISPLEQTHKGRFIERNRLTSGISECVIVIESEGQGGTLHQVNLAINQGRTVFVMEPRKNDERSIRGFREFLRAGAKPFHSSSTILEYLSKHETQKTLDEFTL
jgi:DNA processing protein